MRTTRSTNPSPIPPYSSGEIRPSQPCSASLAQRAGSMASGPSIKVRTFTDGHSFSRNLRAVLRSRSCSSLKPKFMALPFRQAEHALANDVLHDLGGAALDGVGERAEEAVLPQPALDRPFAPPCQLRVGPLDLHGQLLEPLVALHPHHLPRGGLGARQLPFEGLGDRARPRRSAPRASSSQPVARRRSSPSGRSPPSSRRP